MWRVLGPSAGPPAGLQRPRPRERTHSTCILGSCWSTPRCFSSSLMLCSTTVPPVSVLVVHDVNVCGDFSAVWKVQFGAQRHSCRQADLLEQELSISSRGVRGLWTRFQSALLHPANRKLASVGTASCLDHGSIFLVVSRVSQVYLHVNASWTPCGTTLGRNWHTKPWRVLPPGVDLPLIRATCERGVPAHVRL